MELVRRYGSKAITPHYSLLLKSKTEVFDELRWKVDFKVEYKGDVYFYEAKGWITEAFRLKIQWLEWSNPSAYQKLFIVCPNSKRLTLSKKTKLPLNKVITKAMIKNHQIDFVED